MTEKPSYDELKQRVRELEIANEKLSIMEKLFNFSLDMLCVADFDGNFRAINAAFENTLGYSREELLGTQFLDFIHPDDKMATTGAMKQLETGDRVHHFENRYRCKDGSYKWLSWNSVPVVEERFEYAVARDITEQKAIQQELAQQRDLLDSVLSNVPASVFWKDRNSVYLGANEQFAREAGVKSPNELIGKSDYDLAWTKEEADFYRECDRKVMKSGEPLLNIEESQQQANGKVVNILTNKVPLRNSSGQVYGMLGIYMDITTLKQAESEKQRYQQELSHVARLSTIGELATSMAHELNQPLAALVSYCGAARTLLNSLPSPPPQLCEILESAETQAHRASDIIRHLRHFVRKGNNHREFLEFDRLIHAIISFLKIEAQSNNIKIEFYPDCHNCRVEVNKVQIDQVLVNIVRNSIEAIRSAKITNGRIVCRTALLANDSIEVTVSDNGPGIDAAMVEVIFDPFQTSKREGMGLGLSLSRSIIEAHGGSLWVDKGYRGGALFGFRLPTSE